MNRIKLYSLTLSLCCVFSLGKADSDPSRVEGKTLFQAQCAACHNVNFQTVGPPLAKIEQQKSFSWIFGFVKSSKTMVKKGDPEAIAIFSKFQIVMPDHPDITEEQVRSILEYIKSEAKGMPEKSDFTPFQKPLVIHPNYIPVTVHDIGFFIGYLGTILLLILAMILAVKVKEIERSTK